MALLRRFRRRRLFRRRRRFRRAFLRSHPRIRPIGSGPSAKRFFKIRNSIDVMIGPDSSTNIVVVDNPSVFTDWTNITGLFDYYRVCAVKLKYIPSANLVDFPAGASGPKFAPIYIVHDPNTITSTVNTAAVALGYENMRVRNMWLPWSYYTKFVRNIRTSSIVSQTTRGYQPTNTPQSTQSVQLLFENIGTTSSGQIGTLIVSLYLVCRNRL